MQDKSRKGMISCPEIHQIRSRSPRNRAGARKVTAGSGRTPVAKKFGAYLECPTSSCANWRNFVALVSFGDGLLHSRVLYSGVGVSITPQRSESETPSPFANRR
jgi:hypothetical protein